VDLVPMRVTVFPMGSLHVMQNNGMLPLPIPIPYFPFHFQTRQFSRPITTINIFVLESKSMKRADSPHKGCEPSLLLSSLNSDDSGTLNILPSLWNFPTDIIQAGFHDPTINTADLGRSIPEVGTGAIIGSEECKKRCGITIVQ
jgi:hypothetical protein